MSSGKNDVHAYMVSADDVMVVIMSTHALQVTWTDGTSYTIYRPYGEFFTFQSKVRTYVDCKSALVYLQYVRMAHMHVMHVLYVHT